MVEVFKTNIDNEKEASRILMQLLAHLPESLIHFDLEDCDRILRIENFTVQPQDIIQIINQNGFYCEPLE